MKFDAKIPEGPLKEKWTKAKFDLKLVNPANRRKYKIIVVGSGLAGGSAASTLAEQGFDVHCFFYQDSPRRAHSIAAQGGINAAKNYPNDGDSIWRLFYDTVKGGDYRSREANVYRLAEVSNAIIDQCVAQGVPFAREYGGQLDNRSFGGAQVSRTFYARGQTGQQLLLGAYSSYNRQVDKGTLKSYPRTEMLDIVKVDGHARGIITRNLVTGEIEKHAADVVLVATGGYGNVFFLSTNAMGCNATAAWRAHRKGAGFANPCFTQIHPTCIPKASGHQSKLTLMSESLRNDGRVWVPKKAGDDRKPNDIPEDERDYYLERRYPSFGNLVPRDVASRAAKERCDAGHGVGPDMGDGEQKNAVYLDFAEAIERLGKDVVEARYGNLFQMYEMINDENPYEVPMRIFPAVHYTMGGLWVDYNLESNIPGLFVLGEANFSDHGANRLGASALMQGVADGYFVTSATVPDYLAREASMNPEDKVTTDNPAFAEAEAALKARIDKMLAIKGERTVDSIHKELGEIMQDYCGMDRDRAGLEKALKLIPALRNEFWTNVKVLGENESYNTSLEKAGRVADFLELAELMCLDALAREESCGGHCRAEHETPEGEAKRDDEAFTHVAVWEFQGDKDVAWERHQEELVYENVKLTTRSYK